MSKLCTIRNIQHAVNQFENELLEIYGISLNEGMTLCALKEGNELSSGELSALLNLSCSNTSKILRSIEEKGLILRSMGEKDRRHMYFALSAKGESFIGHIDEGRLTIPPLLLPLFKK